MLRWTRFWFRTVLTLSCALGALACASAPPKPKTPENTVIAFARALNQGKLDEAYACMSAEYRARVSLESFKKQVSENPQETLELTSALGHMHPSTHEQAVLRYDDDREIVMRREGDDWHIASPVVDYYDQSTPRAALRAFVRALERERYDVVLRLIPNAGKEGLTTDRMEQAWSGAGGEDVERLLHNLREHLEDAIEVAGNRATLAYGERMRVEMLREDGVWKIETPE